MPSAIMSFGSKLRIYKATTPNNLNTLGCEVYEKDKGFKGIRKCSCWGSQAGNRGFTGMEAAAADAEALNVGSVVRMSARDSADFQGKWTPQSR